MVQIVVGSASPVLLYWIGARLFSRRIGWIAGIILALYGPLVLEEVTLSKTTLLVEAIRTVERLPDETPDAETPATRRRFWSTSGGRLIAGMKYLGQWEERVEQVIADLGTAGLWDAPIVTEVVPLEAFYAAEAYHQDYFANNPYQPYCQVVVAPKVAKARKHFLSKLKKSVAH